MKITSIGWLHRADGDINLTPCIDDNMHPTMVRVAREEYDETGGDQEKMAALALTKLQQNQASN